MLKHVAKQDRFRLEWPSDETSIDYPALLIDGILPCNPEITQERSVFSNSTLPYSVLDVS